MCPEGLCRGLGSLNPYEHSLSFLRNVLIQLEEIWKTPELSSTGVGYVGCEAIVINSSELTFFVDVFRLPSVNRRFQVTAKHVESMGAQATHLSEL